MNENMPSQKTGILNTTTSPMVENSSLITRLHIGHEYTTVTTVNHGGANLQQDLTIGATSTSLAYFRHNPPTAYEMEAAIMAVEDEVIRISPAVNQKSQRVTKDSAIAEIAQLAGLPLQAEFTLPLEAVERMFDRLAAVMMGRPAASEGIPADNVFAARLLILREFMHHLQFPAITVVTETI